MSVKKDPSGHRSVSMEFAIPGTPEQVWQLIATGPGISCWFVPTDVEERIGGGIVFHLGGGMESAGKVTAWEPPLRFAYEESDWSPGAPPVATECIVEARSGGTCVVRMVHSLFASSDEWDEQLEGFEAGWPPFFDIMRIYLKHFAGQPCAALRLMGDSSQPEAEAWQSFTRALGFIGATATERIDTRGGEAPPLAGIVERTGRGKNPHELILRLDEPCVGVALLGVYSWGGTAHAAVSLYLYGEQAPAIVARDQPAWQAWMNKHYAMPTNPPG